MYVRRGKWRRASTHRLIEAARDGGISTHRLWSDGLELVGRWCGRGKAKTVRAVLEMRLLASRA